MTKARCLCILAAMQKVFIIPWKRCTKCGKTVVRGSVAQQFQRAVPSSSARMTPPTAL